jgi:peroxiredoxin
MAFRRTTRTLPALAAALLLASAGDARALAPGDPAVDFQAPSRAGRLLRLSSLRGKVVLIDFWASWCEPCKRELPLLAELAKRLRPRGVEVLAVSLDTSREKLDEFLAAHHIELTVLLDPEGAVAGKYDPPKMPSSFAVDRRGTVRHVNAGFEDGDEKKIERQLLGLAGH